LSGGLVAGALPPRALVLVADWARLHRSELQTNWERARRSESLAPVDPSRRIRRVERLARIVHEAAAAPVVGAAEPSA